MKKFSCIGPWVILLVVGLMIEKSIIGILYIKFLCSFGIIVWIAGFFLHKDDDSVNGFASGIFAVAALAYVLLWW